jgi:hypothetical protein
MKDLANNIVHKNFMLCILLPGLLCLLAVGTPALAIRINVRKTDTGVFAGAQ